MGETLLQVGLNRPHLDGGRGKYVRDLDEMEAALDGSIYRLDRTQTELNDGIAMVITTELEAHRLMETPGYITLPSGYLMEVPTP